MTFLDWCKAKSIFTTLGLEPPKHFLRTAEFLATYRNPEISAQYLSWFESLPAISKGALHQIEELNGSLVAEIGVDEKNFVIPLKKTQNGKLVVACLEPDLKEFAGHPTVPLIFLEQDLRRALRRFKTPSEDLTQQTQHSFLIRIDGEHAISPAGNRVHLKDSHPLRGAFYSTLPYRGFRLASDEKWMKDLGISLSGNFEVIPRGSDLIISAYAPTGGRT